MAEVQGTCDARFASLREAFEERLQSGDELGASIAIVIDGAPVVDMWGGWSDLEHTRRWERDTITNVWSTTKTMAALSVLVLADRVSFINGERDTHLQRVFLHEADSAHLADGDAGVHDVRIAHDTAHIGKHNRKVVCFRGESLELAELNDQSCDRRDADENENANLDLNGSLLRQGPPPVECR